MARAKKAIVVEEKASSVVEQNEPETETNVEMENVSAEETANAEINSVDGENGEVIGAQCVEGGEPEIILGQTMSEEDLPTAGVVTEEKEENEEEEKAEPQAEPQVNLAAGVTTTVVNDPIQGNRVVYQPQTGSNNFGSTEGVRGETARRGEIIKRC